MSDVTTELAMEASDKTMQIARLKAENAKLREIIADLEELLPESERWYSHETVKAISEDNAKLRELVRELYRNFVNCDCELRLHGRTFMAEARYAHRMRELVVEVD